MATATLYDSRLRIEFDVGMDTVCGLFADPVQRLQAKRFYVPS